MSGCVGGWVSAWVRVTDLPSIPNLANIVRFSTIVYVRFSALSPYFSEKEKLCQEI